MLAFALSNSFNTTVMELAAVAGISNFSRTPRGRGPQHHDHQQNSARIVLAPALTCHNCRIASLAYFSAAITELQLKLVHDINVIVLSHSLCSLIGPLVYCVVAYCMCCTFLSFWAFLICPKHICKKTKKIGLFSLRQGRQVAQS